MLFDMGYPSGKSINHYAFHLLFAYACYLAGQEKRHDRLFDILVSCYEFVKQNVFKRSEEIKQRLLLYLINTSKACDKYSKVIEYGKKLCSLIKDASKTKACILSEVGNAYQKLAQYEEALSVLKKSLRISKKINYKEGQVQVYYYLGILYRQKNEFKEALEYLEKQLKISKEIRDKNGEGAAYNGLGNVYCTIGEYAEAREYMERSVRISEAAGHKIVIGRRYHDLANVYTLTGEQKKALNYYERALKIAEEVGDKEGEDRACSSLGRLYRSKQELQKAFDYNIRSLEISKELGDNRGLATQYANLGNISTDMGDIKKSLELHAKALQMYGECGDFEGEMKSFFSSGSACFRINKISAGCNNFCKNIIIGDKLRKDFEKRDQLNMSMAKLDFKAHVHLMLGLLVLKHIKKALLVLDVGRSKALFDLLRLSSSGVNDSLLENRSIRWIEQIPSMLDDPNEDSHSDISEHVCRQSLRDGSVILFGLNPTYAKLLTWVLTNQGTFFEIWTPAESTGITAWDYFSKVLEHVTPTRGSKPGLEDPRDSLRKRNTETLYKIPDEMQNVNLEVGHTARERKRNDFPEAKGVDEFENLGGNNTDATLRGPSKQADRAKRWLVAAYQALIDPIKHHLTGSKLVIVPADLLFLLPFPALLDRDGKYLCDHYSIQVTPSLHSLNFSLSVQLKPLGPALCVGNPPVCKVIFGGKVVNLPEFLSSLPYAEVEAADCATYFEAVPLLNKQATKKKVLERMKKASVIHIAAHGNMDYGEIFLAPNPKVPLPPEEKHYLLMPQDIILNSLSARLVVLSCCHSGRGEVSSEGVAGTARAFLGAGARAVLVALWALPDKDTCNLMKLFYENVCKGLSVCVALQQAMRTFKEEDDRMEAWAPFEIFGQDITITSEDLETIRRLSRERKE